MSERYRGPLGGLRRWNRRRTEQRRWQREALAALVADDEATLEALAHLLERVREGFEAQATAQAAAQAAARAEVLRRLEAIDAGRAELLGRLGALEAGQAEALRRLAAPVAGDAGWPVIATSRGGLLEPELDLLAHLAPALPSRLAIDVGAHHGRFTSALLDLGFTVHALEPNPAVREVLERRLAGRSGITVHALAAGAEDGEAELRLAANPEGDYVDPTELASLSGLPLAPGLVPAGAARVAVRRLDGLLREQGLGTPALVKVDAEGLDLDVLRGLGDLRPAVVVAEFWDDDFPFSAPGARNRLPDLVAHARRHGAPWHLVVFRRWGDHRPAFYAGLSGSPERSWGNVIFFADRALFERAREFLTGVLPEARFVAAPGPGPGRAT